MTDERPTFGSLFAGIGGIDLGLERAGWRCEFQVEWDAYCQRVLAKHWPDVPRFGDIHDVHGPGAHVLADAQRQPVRGRNSMDGSTGARESQGQERKRLRFDAGSGHADRRCPDCLPEVDLLAGGFPCQPFSNAGQRRGVEDDRWLWPEFARLVRDLRPKYVLVENVPGLLAGHGGMGHVLGDLAALGYDAEWESIPAAAVGAPHLRYRVWIIGTLAHPDVVGGLGDGGLSGNGHPSQWDDAYRRGREAAVAYADGIGQRRQAEVGPSGITGPRPGQAGAEPDGAGSGTLLDTIGQRGRGGSSWIEDAEDAWERPEGPGLRYWDSEPRLGEPADGLPEGLASPWGPGWEDGTPRVATGVPDRVHRLRALGNAVVPQVVEWIGRRIIEADTIT